MRNTWSRLRPSSTRNPEPMEGFFGRSSRAPFPPQVFFRPSVCRHCLPSVFSFLSFSFLSSPIVSCFPLLSCSHKSKAGLRIITTTPARTTRTTTVVRRICETNFHPLQRCPCRHHRRRRRRRLPILQFMVCRDPIHQHSRQHRRRCRHFQSEGSDRRQSRRFV